MWMVSGTSGVAGRRSGPRLAYVVLTGAAAAAFAVAAEAASPPTPQQVVQRWRSNGGRVLLEHEFRFANHWASPAALGYAQWIKPPCPDLKRCRKYQAAVVDQDTRREYPFRIGNPGWLFVVAETWSEHWMHPPVALQYLDTASGTWRELTCRGTQGVRVYKHGENNAAWLALYDLAAFPKVRCFVERDTRFRVLVTAPYSHDGRERFRGHGKIWVLFAPEGRAAAPRWVRSLHRRTYQQVALPFNWCAVLNPVLAAWLRVSLPDTNWGCTGCEAFYATIVRGRPSSFEYRYASDNTARLYVNGEMVYDGHFEQRDWCTEAPCCARCCDTPTNCTRVLQGEPWRSLPPGVLRDRFTPADNVVIWRVRQDGGGCGFHCQLRVAGASLVEPAPGGDVTGH